MISSTEMPEGQQGGGRQLEIGSHHQSGAVGLKLPSKTFHLSFTHVRSGPGFSDLFSFSLHLLSNPSTRAASKKRYLKTPEDTAKMFIYFLCMCSVSTMHSSHLVLHSCQSLGVCFYDSFTSKERHFTSFFILNQLKLSQTGWFNAALGSHFWKIIIKTQNYEKKS